MKTTVLAIALALAAVPLTFAAANPPAKTGSTAKKADKTAKKNPKDTAKKAAVKTGATTAAPAVK
jgi:hypothetical protein